MRERTPDTAAPNVSRVAEGKPEGRPSSALAAGISLRQRILIADDDRSVRESLQRVLESEQFEVEIAGDGHEAVLKFSSHPPDLVLLDLNMPGLDGWGAFDRMERLQPFVPFIVITARSYEYDRAVAAGMDAFMEKPLDVATLLQTMRRLLAESESRRIARLTDRNFATMDLSHVSPLPADQTPGPERESPAAWTRVPGYD